VLRPEWVGKSHAAAAIGYALIERGKGVLFVRTTDMVQRLQAARRDLVLPAVLAKLDKFDAVVLDDLGYARKDQAETAMLFELIAERYDRRSLVISWSPIRPISLTPFLPGQPDDGAAISPAASSSSSRSPAPW
jgi:DNA replication protein DnaC